MKYKAITLFFIVSTSCLPASAQDEFWSANWHSERAKSHVKQVIILERSGKRFDTLHIYKYDTLGRKTNAVNFGYKKSGNSSHMTFVFRDTLCTSWTTKYKFGDVETGTYKYDTRGNLLISRYYRIKLKDTILRQTSIYTYNSRHQLIKHKLIDNGLPDWEVSYFYIKDKLTRIKTHPYKGRNSYREELYYYNSSGILDSTRDNTINEQSKKVQEFKLCRYENGRIVETMYKNRKGTVNLMHYTYNTDGQIDSSNAVEDTSYTITKYRYINGKLASEKTATNISPIPPDTYSAYKMKTLHNQFIIEIQYIYDSKGNMTERTKTLNGEITDQRKFVIEYY